jgi:hypothetical protein
MAEVCGVATHSLRCSNIGGTLVHALSLAFLS